MCRTCYTNISSDSLEATTMYNQRIALLLFQSFLFAQCLGDVSETIAVKSGPLSVRKGQARDSGNREHDLLNEVCAKVCTFWGCTTYYCPDGVCCIPGSPLSRCCPYDKPECLDNQYCCAPGRTRLCGRICCYPSDKCCGTSNQFCCPNEKSCCGTDSCCTNSATCCRKNNDQSSCCDKSTKSCCGEKFGCLSTCSSLSDSSGCQNEFTETETLRFLSEFNAPLVDGPGIPCPAWDRKTLYRILRVEENCETGLLAKAVGDHKTVEEHVGCGGNLGFVSQYISTSTVLAISQWYSRGLRIARIDVDKISSSCLVIDLSNEAGRSLHLDSIRAKNFARASCEVLLSCGTNPVPCSYTTQSP